MTFSIAGICARTGQIGYAVTTSSVAVGARVGAGIAGQAIVLSQARTDPRLHAVGIACIADGGSAPKAVAAMVDAAAGFEQWRQLGVLLADGTAAAHTGVSCTDHGGHVAGDSCLALGNALRGQVVVEAMARAFEERSERSLSERLIAALVAGSDAGGEWTPLQSAALRVFAEHEFPYADLRVDLSQAPLTDLAMLWKDFEPKAPAYLLRAVDPASAPPADEIENQGAAGR